MGRPRTLGPQTASTFSTTPSTFTTLTRPARRHVVALDLPGRVVEADLAGVVDDRLVEGEQSADVLLTAPIERRLVGLGGVALVVDAPAGDRPHREHGEYQHLVLPGQRRRRPQHQADGPRRDAQPQEDRAGRQRLDDDQHDAGHPPVPELDAFKVFHRLYLRAARPAVAGRPYAQRSSPATDDITSASGPGPRGAISAMPPIEPITLATSTGRKKTF